MNRKQDIDSDNQSQKQENIIHISGMYENWFLDYASYVILSFCPIYSGWIETCSKKDFTLVKTVR